MIRCLGRRVEDLLLFVVGHLPAVRRVRFLNVDYEELHPVAILGAKLLQPARLVAEGRSGVGAEEKGYRLPSEGAEGHSLAVSVKDGQLKSGASSPTFGASSSRRIISSRRT